MRPIQRHERARWDALIYLGFKQTVGRALRQRPIQFQRLHLIVNNARFLILPGVQVPHLASRVLGQSLRRLAGDWECVHGYRPLLAETFVDPARFQGTCYRAANWRCLGHTRGYARHAGRYCHHGHPKTVWVYPASLTDSLILVFLGAGTYPRQPDRPFLMPACVPGEVILVFFALQGDPRGAFSMEQTHRPLSTLS